MSFLNLMRNRLKPKEVNAALSDIKNKIDTNTAYTPPAYSSTEEVNTGQKWIDGKDIYCKYFSGDLPEIVSQTTINLFQIENISRLISLNILYVPVSGNTAYNCFNILITSSNYIQAVSVSSSYSSGTFSGVVYYTKTSPTISNARAVNGTEPVDKGTGEEPEQETKTTKRTKKTTK